MSNLRKIIVIGICEIVSCLLWMFLFIHYCYNTTGEIRFRMQEHLLIEMTPHFKVPTLTKNIQHRAENEA